MNEETPPTCRPRLNVEWRYDDEAAPDDQTPEPHRNIEVALANLDQLADKIARNSARPARKDWGGAGVVISAQAPTPSTDSFYPDPRTVVTANSLYVSWLFGELKHAFRAIIDSCTKFEFFGRLANAAVRYQSLCDGVEVRRDLLLAVLHEAFAMLDEMDKGEFAFLGVTVGNAIADDRIQRKAARGFDTVAETKKFFAARGIKLE